MRRRLQSNRCGRALQGTVRYLNREDATMALETAPGPFTIVGPRDDVTADAGDEIEGALDGDGAVTLRNASRDTRLSAYIERTDASDDAARASAG